MTTILIIHTIAVDAKTICMMLTMTVDGFWKKYHVKIDLHKSTPSGFSKAFTGICTHTHTHPLLRVLSLIYVCVFLPIDATLVFEHMYIL